jgi:hypothetical protein
MPNTRKAASRVQTVFSGLTTSLPVSLSVRLLPRPGGRVSGDEHDRAEERRQPEHLAGHQQVAVTAHSGSRNLARRRASLSMRARVR